MHEVVKAVRLSPTQLPSYSSGFVKELDFRTNDFLEAKGSSAFWKMATVWILENRILWIAYKIRCTCGRMTYLYFPWNKRRPVLAFSKKNYPVKSSWLHSDRFWRSNSHGSYRICDHPQRSAGRTRLITESECPRDLQQLMMDQYFPNADYYSLRSRPQLRDWRRAVSIE